MVLLHDILGQYCSRKYRFGIIGEVLETTEFEYRELLHKILENY